MKRGHIWTIPSTAHGRKYTGNKGGYHLLEQNQCNRLSAHPRKAPKTRLISGAPYYRVRIPLLSAYGHIAKMRFMIIQKLRKAGAVSPEKAVAPQDADLSLPELQWLRFLAGAFSKIRKTQDGRFYTSG